MYKKYFSRLNKIYTAGLILSATNLFAASLNIVPDGTLPATISSGQTAVANYIVTNMTNTTLTGYTLQGLPTTVTQNITSPNCGSTINLAPSASCNLQLSTTTPVSFNFAFCKGSNCSGPNTPLKITAYTGPIAKFAYIGEGYGGSSNVSLCALNPTTGAVSSCQNAGGDSVLSTAGGIAGITLNSGGTVAYITNASNGNNTVFQCTINQTTKQFENCSSTAITSLSYLPYYGQPVLNSAGTIAYLVNYGTNEVFACPIIAGVITDSCVNTNASGINQSLVQMALSPNDSTAYIGSFGGVVRCNVSGNSFSGCSSVTGDGSISFSSPTGVALSNTGSRIYVAEDAAPNNIYVCSTSMNGANFSSCAIAYANLPTAAWSITINAANSVAYITDYINTTYECAIYSGDGTFSNCVATTAAPIPTSTALLY